MIRGIGAGRIALFGVALLVLAWGGYRLVAPLATSPTLGTAAHPGEEVTVAQVKAWMDAGRPIALLDVREPWEWRIVHLPGAQLMPLGDLDPASIRHRPADLVVVYCAEGVRSLKAVRRLRAMGFEEAVSLAGGIDRWAVEIDPSLPRY